VDGGGGEGRGHDGLASATVEGGCGGGEGRQSRMGCDGGGALDTMD
jgi:hypothetical protein